MTLEIDAKLVEPFAQRLVCMAGEMASRTQQRNLETIRGWSGVTFVNYPTGYTPQMWTDIVHDQADMVVETLVQQATRWEAKSVELGGQEGEVEGSRIALRAQAHRFSSSLSAFAPASGMQLWGS